MIHANCKITFLRSHSLGYHSIKRRIFVLTNSIVNLLKQIENLSPQDCNSPTGKHQNMARIYLTAAVLELERMAEAANRDYKQKTITDLRFKRDRA